MSCLPARAPNVLPLKLGHYQIELLDAIGEFANLHRAMSHSSGAIPDLIAIASAKDSGRLRDPAGVSELILVRARREECPKPSTDGERTDLAVASAGVLASVA